jgi:hypothetical protein
MSRSFHKGFYLQVNCVIVGLLDLGFFIVGLSAAKVAMATIAYCAFSTRTKSIAAFRYRGSIDIF